ncbi:MAG: class I SAM-dependent methyltransferase [archaeon]|nr:class I SAM-dependent methyltransferase [archaeon]
MVKSKNTHKYKKAQYDAISHSYTALAQIDPSKQFVQYPETLRLMGDVRGKLVLDVGCGAGLLTRLIASKGAKVIAYDNSTEQIKFALKQNGTANIRYFIADSDNIESKIKKAISSFSGFDIAVSTLVLLYAENINHLEEFFQSTYRLLKDGSRFVSVTFNPEYSNFRVAKYRRIFSKQNSRIKVDFLDENEHINATALFSNFSKEDYENAAKKAGFGQLEWVSLNVSKEGMTKMGKEYWTDYKKDSPYIGFVVTKCSK